MGRIQIYNDSSSSWQGLVQDAERELNVPLPDELRHYLSLLLAKQQDHVLEEVDWPEYWMGGLQAHVALPLRDVQKAAEASLITLGLYPGRIIKCSDGLDLAMSCSYGLYHHLSERSEGQVGLNAALFAEVAGHLVVLVDVLMMLQERAQKHCVLERMDAERFLDNFPDAHYPRHVLSQFNGHAGPHFWPSR